MSKYKLVNVIKITDDALEAQRLLALGYKKVEVSNAPTVVEYIEITETIEKVGPTIAELKAILNERGIEYRAKATKSELIALVDGE